jgi:hypothetical protein
LASTVILPILLGSIWLQVTAPGVGEAVPVAGAPLSVVVAPGVADPAPGDAVSAGEAWAVPEAPGDAVADEGLPAGWFPPEHPVSDPATSRHAARAQSPERMDHAAVLVMG